MVHNVLSWLKHNVLMFIDAPSFDLLHRNKSDDVTGQTKHVVIS